ncbi:MAG TPA: single-stranded DNA-binding protein [Chitinispirillaceae bacterium]|jgi:single-strand DNA-binding protein|nr:single-stranded DNA-binding protein [Chitinispirillaceae bacterium]
MIGVNKAILIGHLGKDPDVRSTAGGQPVATFSLATSERFTDRNGQRQDRTEWHTVVAWGKLAELAGQYLKKGRSVYVEGRITTRSWDDRDGNKRYKTEIVATQIQFLSGSGNGPVSEMDSSSSSTSSFDMNQAMPETAPMVEEDLPF